MSADVFCGQKYFTYQDFKNAIAEFKYLLTTPNCKFNKYLANILHLFFYLKTII
jgi:cytochrome c peroxidase